MFSYFVSVSLLLCTITQSLASDKEELIVVDTENKTEAEFVGLPFAFSTETMSTAIGAAGLIKSAGQPQASILGIAAYSSNKSHVAFIAANSYQLPKTNRWLFSAEYYGAVFPEGIYFLDDQDPATQLAGLNNSEESTQITTHGVQKDLRLHFRYYLPFGQGKDGALATLATDKEVSSLWDITKSGVSSINFSPFFEELDLAEYNDLQRSTTAAGLTVEFTWDNRNSASNALEGNYAQLSFKYGQDNDEIPSWLTWKFDYAHFLQLPNNSLTNNHVIALNMVVADTPTWDQVDNGSYRRPPVFAGNSLGGFNSLRGYPSRRFHGRSSLLYSAEYRVQPKWQPLGDIFEGYYKVPWWQWVAYVEAGRVSNNFDIEELHQDMHLSVGIGARFQVEGIVVRTEYAKSKEGGQLWVMVNQPF
ncbi:hypothetical protein [Thalassotalea sp. PLHSN55]|uniref:hypothetical protein n=1 Tax=Thalassotalea sp. PLHSN55 TaxID=3435888 RepID=UPI003F85EEC6